MVLAQTMLRSGEHQGTVSQLLYGLGLVVHAGATRQSSDIRDAIIIARHRFEELAGTDHAAIQRHQAKLMNASLGWFPDEIVRIRRVDPDGLDCLDATQLRFIGVTGEDDVSIHSHEPESEFTGFDFVALKYCRHSASLDIHIQRMA